jgi:hypothetical protein
MAERVEAHTDPPESPPNDSPDPELREGAGLIHSNRTQLLPAKPIGFLSEPERRALIASIDRQIDEIDQRLRF